MGARHFCSVYHHVSILVCVSSLFIMSGESISIRCSKLLEKINYCQRRSSSDTSQMPLYRDVPKVETKEVPTFNEDLYIESPNAISDPALQREIESALSLQNPVHYNIPMMDEPLLHPQVMLHQEGKLSKNRIINKLYRYITWEEAQKRSVSKVAKVAGRISGDIAAMMMAEKFRKIGMFAGDLTRILVSDLTMKGLDGFQAMLGIKI